MTVTAMITIICKFFFDSVPSNICKCGVCLSKYFMKLDNIYHELGEFLLNSCFFIEIAYFFYDIVYLSINMQI